MLNLTIQDARSAGEIVLRAAGGDRIMAEKAIMAASNPSGGSFNLDRAVEFVRVIKNWPAVRAALETGVFP